MLGQCIFLWLLVPLLGILKVSDASAVCRDPEVPKDGWRSSPSRHVFNIGDTVHYYCKANYTLSGVPKVLCLSDGTWDHKPPVCSDPCGICDNGGMCIHQTQKNKFACVCKSGYRGNNCGIPYCIKPDAVVNGAYYAMTPRGRAKYDVGSSLMFSCNIGYRLIGRNDIKCIPSGIAARWAYNLPVCQRRRCLNPLESSRLSNGEYSPSYASYAIGDIVTFTCNAGFELHGTTNVKCQVSGLWSAVTWPRCAHKFCPSPPVPPNGRVIYSSDKLSAGTTIQYTCRTGLGYFLYGQPSQTCLANANGNMIWSPARPQCITRLLFQQYCAMQNKVMSFEPTAGCVRKTAVFGGQTSVKRSASIDTLTIVTGTAGGLLGFLLVIVAFVICQRRRLVRRMRLATSRRARTSEDERMLIYCSNDFHFFLPSYDEAMRSRPAEPPPFETVVSDDDDATASNPAPISEVNHQQEHQYEVIETILDRSPDSAIHNADDLVYSFVERQSPDVVEVATEVVTEAEDHVDPELNMETRPSSNSLSSSDDSVVDENQPLC